jgi:predicted nucleotidyltransferase
MNNLLHADMVINSVTDICRQFGATGVILFGSRADGCAVEKSDIDIAVQGNGIDFRAIDEAIDKILSLLTINIVDMSTASPNLRRDIESYGKLLYKA